MARSAVPTALGAMLIAAIAAACSGYSTKRLTDFPSARTIAIVPFANTGFYRDQELRLTEAVAREVRARSQLGFGTPSNADLILTGTMESWETPVVLDRDGEVIQKRLEGWLAVTITERVSGREVRRARVKATSEWRPGTMGETLEGSATEEWIDRLAEQVAQQLEKGF